jgi:hypothetical protein
MLKCLAHFYCEAKLNENELKRLAREIQGLNKDYGSNHG